MNIYPYVYRIDHKSGEFYIGYRCANRVPAEADIGHKYKTSSKHLSHPFEEYSITIIAEFFTGTAKADAYDFEQALIYENWDNPNLANQHCSYGKTRWSTSGQVRSQLFREKMSDLVSGKRHSPEAKEKMSESAKHRGKSYFPS